MSPRLRLVTAAGAVFVVAVAALLYWFQPWRLVTNSTVHEDLPVADAPNPTGTPGAPSTAPPPARNVLLASGTLIAHEHETSGEARLIRLADGRVQLVLENLSTSDGPDLRVWLTNQPVIEGRAGWFVFDDDRYVEVGALKANNGDQVYDVPPGTDLNGLTSVAIWCKRFSVSFGAAQLEPA